MSLKRITLRDFVIVTQLELELSNGFTALTGETGAGKSILIDALQLALGARADSGLVREGAARTEVSLEFDDCAHLQTWLDEAGFEALDTLLVKRSVDAQGKSRAWINGSAATASQLRELGEQLLDIHGQHAWQSLTRPDAVRGLLDAYAGVQLDALTRTWEHWRKTQQVLAQAQSSQDSLQVQRDRLSWQIAELEKLNPGPDEWTELNAQHTRLAHAHALLDATSLALVALEDDEHGALTRLAQAQHAMSAHEHLEPQFKPLYETLVGALTHAQDAAHGLRAYQRHIEMDPDRLTQLDARMAQWLSLARRYRQPPQALATLLTNWRTELAQLNANADLEQLERAQDLAQQAYLAQAQRVSQLRAQAAPKLSQAISLAMQGLGMQGGRFEVQLDHLTQPASSGLEEVSFLVAGHPGSTPRPVGKVASGGELSRMALAIAVTTSQLGRAQTLVFDEVDAGVGGAVAQTVGRLMQQLGQDRQVLAVTHLPQVAACAHTHLVVAKQQQGTATSSSVVLVQADARVNEIARMLGGQQLTDTSRAHALEMLNSKP